MTNTEWIALADVIVSAVSAVAVAWLAFILGVRAKRLENTLSVSTVLVGKRIEQFDLLSGYFNDLYCYATYVGSWRTLSPVEIIETKRKVDRAFFSALPYWDHLTVDAYRKFMDSLFRVGNGKGKSVLLLCNFERHKDECSLPGGFRPEWELLFVMKEERSEIRAVNEAYSKLMTSIAMSFHRTSGE